MAITVSATSRSLRHGFDQPSFLSTKPNNSITTSIPSFHKKGFVWKKKQSFEICLVAKKKTEDVVFEVTVKEEEGEAFDHDLINNNRPLISRTEEKLTIKKLEKTTYLVAAIMSSLGITSMAAASVYYRFSLQMEGGEIPALEMFGTFALSVGAAIGMEFWARWAHRALWHDSLWHMHESHHRAREGPFEVNDVFAIINAIPAISLMAYGFSNKGLIPGLCFGAGLGITIFGMAYMFVHDGLVHRRFPVGPIADVPYLRRVAAAHHLHHSNKFDGVPYGLYFGPQELESKVGGKEELEKELNRMMKQSKGN